MNEQEQSKGEKGEFFAMNLLQIDDMVRADAGAEEIMAYMVLARGVNKRGNLSISTHGANSVSARTGMSNRRAKSALEWLENNQFTSSIGSSSDSPKHLGKGEGKKHMARWFLSESVNKEDIYLAHSLTDGIGAGRNNPPLMRIYGEVSNSVSGLLSDARIDALMVMLHLYRYMDMADCGGVDPRAGLYREWVNTENSDGEKVVDIEGTTGALYEIEGSSSYVFTKFANEALFYVDDDERSDRFWSAMHNLHNLGIMYEVIQVWSADPNGKNGRKAELLYTLYIKDRHAREKEPYLQREIHDTAQHFDAMGFVEAETGMFRYIANKKTGGFPIGVYRLRFRPKTRDMGIGIAAERSRVARWSKGLTSLVNHF